MTVEALDLAWATPGDAAALAAVHAEAFDAPWGASEFDELLAGPGVFGLLAGGAPALGMAVLRIAAGEMEVLTIGVSGAARRKGVARALMAAAIAAAQAAGAEAILLEVAVDNAPAVALYDRLGFVRVGLRRGYYDRNDKGHADALVMRLDVSPASA